MTSSTKLILRKKSLRTRSPQPGLLQVSSIKKQMFRRPTMHLMILTRTARSWCKLRIKTGSTSTTLMRNKRCPNNLRRYIGAQSWLWNLTRAKKTKSSRVPISKMSSSTVLDHYQLWKILECSNKAKLSKKTWSPPMIFMRIAWTSKVPCLSKFGSLDISS